RIHLARPADKSQVFGPAVGPKAQLARLNQASVAAADSQRRNALTLKLSHPPLVHDTGQHHQRHVARGGIGDAQPLAKLGRDVQARERLGQQLAAAMDDNHAMAAPPEFCDLPGDAPPSASVLESVAADFDHQSHRRAISCGNPYIRFMFSTAWPAAPLPRLSSVETTTSRRVPRSSAKPRS